MTSKRWFGVLSLLAILAVAYMDRINVSLLIANSDFTHTLGLTGDRVAQGRLMTMFLVGYGLSAWFVTPLFEARYSVRVGLLVSLLLWTVLTGASAMAAGVGLFLALRFLLGIAEGPLFSLKTMFIQDQFAPKEVGKPNAVSSLGVNLGLGLGYPILGRLMVGFGWRRSFWALAAINLVVGIPLVLAFIGGRRRTGDRAKPAPAALDLLRLALRTPMLPVILLVEICTLSYLWGSSTWLPSYLLAARHFSLAEMSVFAGLPFVAGVAANFASGALLDALPTRCAPLVFVAGGAATAASVVLALTAQTPLVSALALIAAGAGWAFQGPAIPTLVQHVSAPGTVGSTYGVINGVGNLVAALMPMMMGAAMSSSSGESLARGFWLLVGTQILTVACGLVLLQRLSKSEPVGEPAGG